MKLMYKNLKKIEENSPTLFFFVFLVCISGICIVPLCIKLSEDKTPEMVEIRASKAIVENHSLCSKPVQQTVESCIEDSVEIPFTPEEIDYLCRCVEAEAGNQSELGKRLICDVILNRYDKGTYTSIKAVIDEKNQFEVVSNGSINKVKVTENTVKIVNEELENRTNSEVLYFRTQHYHTFGTPLFQEDDHYFSK